MNHSRWKLKREQELGAEHTESEEVRALDASLSIALDEDQEEVAFVARPEEVAFVARPEEVAFVARPAA